MGCINCGSGEPTGDLGELTTKIRNKLKQNYEKEKMSTEYKEDCTCPGCMIRRSYESMQEEFRKNLEANSKEETENSIEEILSSNPAKHFIPLVFDINNLTEEECGCEEEPEVEIPTLSETVNEILKSTAVKYRERDGRKKHHTSLRKALDKVDELFKEGGFKRGEAFVVVSETDSSKSQLGEAEEPTFSDSIEELIEDEVNRRVKERLDKLIAIIEEIK